MLQQEQGKQEGIFLRRILPQDTEISRCFHDKVEIYPQILINVKVKNKEETVNDERVKQVVQNVEGKINGNGRVLLRPSGTEPVIRIMVECEDEDNSKAYAEEIRDTIVSRGHCVE